MHACDTHGGGVVLFVKGPTPSCDVHAHKSEIFNPGRKAGGCWDNDLSSKT